MASLNESHYSGPELKGWLTGASLGKFSKMPIDWKGTNVQTGGKGGRQPLKSPKLIPQMELIIKLGTYEYHNYQQSLGSINCAK